MTQSKNTPILAFLSHHKAGTAWISNIVYSFFSSYCKLNYGGYYSPKGFHYDLNSTIRQHNIDFFSYVNADPQYLQDIDSLKAFHVIRDPRDMIVSAYFSHLNSHPTEH